MNACEPAPLQPAGTRIVGAMPSQDLLVEPLAVSRRQLFAPRGAVVGADGTLWVADSGHHRLLGWRGANWYPGQDADRLLGQPDAESEARNAGNRLPQAQAMNLPVGLCVAGQALLVADAWNHRVLIWHQAPGSDLQAPDCVLGQADLASIAINRGLTEPGADTLYWPYGLHWDGTHLLVCDTGNRRVLVWQGLPDSNGQPADLVLGQRDFHTRDENGGGTPDARSMRWPHAVCRWQGRLCVADAGNNRIMVWDRMPSACNAPADHVLGQPDFSATSNLGGGMKPRADVLSMPYGLTVLDEQLWVADTANSRLLAWSADELRTGAAASGVFGQPDFLQRGENRWGPPGADSLCWPYGLSTCSDQLVISDTGNHRVMLVPPEALSRST